MKKRLVDGLITIAGLFVGVAMPIIGMPILLDICGFKLSPQIFDICAIGVTIGFISGLVTLHVLREQQLWNQLRPIDKKTEGAD